MSRPGKVRALLATLRIANAPSVVSNVFLGCMTGWAVYHFWADPRQYDWVLTSMACLSGVLLYFSGNLANDWFDRRWDAEKRPERALPAGLFRPSSYLFCAAVLAVAAVSLAFTLGLASGGTAVAICLLIVIYTWFHKEAIWATVPMGLCRAGLYFLGYFAWWELPFSELRLKFRMTSVNVVEEIAERLRLPGAFATGLFCYIVGLSLSARYEGMENPPQGPKIISLALLILPIAAMSSSFMGYEPLAGAIGVIPFAVWLTLCLTYFKKPIPRYVSALLAGIPLVDLMAAVPLYRYLHGRAPTTTLSEAPHLAAILAVPVIAFILGRALQRLAPAT